MTTCWAIEFDYRSDDGPRVVGPFPTKEAASVWLDQLHVDHEAGFVEIAAP